jgi:CubicO group peptidase (beta-lactamase class C family)
MPDSQMGEAFTFGGRCAARFEGVRTALARNFREHGEVGCAAAVSVEGRVVVDLWGGWQDRARTGLWQPDTLVNVFSVGKPMAAICLLRLVEYRRRVRVALNDRADYQR